MLIYLQMRMRSQCHASFSVYGSAFALNHFFAEYLPVSCQQVRSGGVLMQLLWAGGHTAAHLSTAVCLMLLLELAVEMCIR